MYQFLAEAEVSTYMKVEKVNGSVRYFAVINDQNYEIDEQSYLLGTEEQ